ncbi:hypothetical protein FHT86_002052 [Rhizobium sp. BK313]|uniref:hypothetical protein n=1 Tax=Rhizobium sp. BK313 TaxID=2587081 RepID=UPI001415122D|nr:hypothetical protein [Rhizobium sp. BK313]MBB3453796.1 hypothetical protein [Rhizobium sp. BK313]
MEKVAQIYAGNEQAQEENRDFSHMQKAVTAGSVLLTPPQTMSLGSETTPKEA